MDDCRPEDDEAGDDEQAPDAGSEEAAAAQPARPGGGWGEVAAVLAAGVVPNVASAVVHAFHPDPPDPARYLADALAHTAESTCIAFIVLYLIRRSGEPWRRFGLVRPRPSDFLLVGPALVLVWWLV
jgi:hypothetical protein